MCLSVWSYRSKKAFLYAPMVPWLGLSRFTSTPRRQTINPIYTLHSGGHPDHGIAFRSRLCAKLARKQPSFGEGSSPEDHLAWPAYARLEQEPRSPSARFRHRFSDCQSYQKVSSKRMKVVVNDEGSCQVTGNWRFGTVEGQS